ncbi:hypothetical protein A3K48_04095 [candidate division WOR-1 bacterium RIFOXYA12_FULL_52_29]|uniref:Trk family potassium uptake protein n=1 Tax=candidate division WOR-1 bacterium RIFOXYC12_FULL_54_18 TaxID=1802584 RepID=A0A1F4T5W8_UNCSA|nr:MAG: hypothetical protein A3K44_04095 [candidate division WOR-1 bacterium RIFOXYA2_FULL_51_19]OGC17735.1 MAG: hypothetical protein A3K48_04095 [candidate division WOR-1 bacterium RIFOXYA12_FULL_52_29]OGC26592.1 MAG: hypothetical protein A3K32_04090 [candidate division WOR-1 bacterium RIFOXYB2_FULL_45_9]OGC28152.1 MAG: hypothetical protein A3K49_04095 [candidate division WOR-1 bacterium RIFOXYC12_FULL_54_18]OGC29562.1 MAG: hypothetical protein A2346_02240 [candidate division WOR-1 bacterium R
MLRIRASALIALSFLAVIFAGGTLLSLPIASAQNIPTNFLDAYFTANSATCVTGLVTLNTGTHFSLFGILVILALIQIGGLGYMTFSTFMVLVFRQKLFISQKLAVQEALNVYSTKDVISVLKKVFGIVFILEAIGAAILYARWLPEMGSSQALLYAVFHAISAFNNAGFALTSNFASLLPYSADWIVNLTITSLIVIGGIGFIVIADIIERRRLALHSKVVLLVTFLLISLGTILIFTLEYNNPSTLGPLTLPHKMLASYFQSVTARTAGFNTLNIGQLTQPTLLFFLFLMFIGASPGGTGGGIKTTTFAVIIGTIIATLRGFRNTIMFNRRIPVETVRRAITITFLALTVIALAIFALDNLESFGLMPVAFEIFSAFGTVGLSMGITPSLSPLGKIIIMLVMFIGRVGPLTMLIGLTMSQRDNKVEPPKEGLSIG